MQANGTCVIADLGLAVLYSKEIDIGRPNHRVFQIYIYSALLLPVDYAAVSLFLVIVPRSTTLMGLDLKNIKWFFRFLVEHIRN